MTERDLQDAIVGAARLLGWRVFHPYDSRRSVAGWPDLTLVRGERLIFAELKTDKGKLSAEQLDWLAALQTAGQKTYVWRPEHWLSGRVEEVLRGSD